MRFKFMAFAFIISLMISNLSADINARYYSQRNSIDVDEKHWGGLISHALNSNSPCYSYRGNTCYTNGRGENCYTFTYSPSVTTPALFRDRMIQFTYDSSINQCFDNKKGRKFFINPLPVLAATGKKRRKSYCLVCYMGRICANSKRWRLEIYTITSW